MADSKDRDKLVLYITERMVNYLEMPPEHRKLARRERSKKRETWSYRMFGFLPFTIQSWFRSAKKLTKFR